jgi:hypothetical protein
LAELKQREQEQLRIKQRKFQESYRIFYGLDETPSLEVVEQAVRGKKANRIQEKNALLAQGRNPQFPEDKK